MNPGGDVCAVQALPPSVVTRTAPPDEFPPTAQQSEVLAQKTLFRPATALGSVCSVHVLPPSVVATTTPSAEEVSPTAQQSEVLAHVRPKRNAVVGTVCSFQVLPASVVATTTSFPEELRPSARQSAVLVHEILDRRPTPLGRVCAVQALPPSEVTTTAPAPFFTPTAQQSDVVGQESPLTVAPGFSVVQVLPPSVVARTCWSDATAQQSNVLAHWTPKRRGPFGTTCSVQIVPPSLVASMTAAPGEFPPTTQQSDVLGHETP